LKESGARTTFFIFFGQTAPLWQKGRRMTAQAEIRAFLANKRKFGLPLLAAGTLLVAIPLGVHAKSDEEGRYPFDPVCPWGRLSNGQGMIHRCLTKGEAEGLARKDDATAKPSGQADKESKQGEPKSEKETSDKSTPLLPDFDLNVGPIKAEDGEITIGRLGQPIDKYRSCVDAKGGLQGKKAEVIVKFLVRGERARAEGVSVESYKGVSKAAAECIAEVIDRRQVGAPSVPLTAARLTFSIQAK
jgi:hypothetical protein